MTLRSLLTKSGLIIGVFSLLSGLSFAQSNNLNTSQAKVTQSGPSMKLGKAVSNPRLGQAFSIYVRNNGNAQLTNIHIASDNRDQLTIDDNQCATGLTPGKTCQIKITGSSKKLAGKHAISVASKQTSAQSIFVNFAQSSIKSHFESSQPFKAGQTITLDIQAGPPISPDANVNPAQVNYSLNNVQAKSQNGQLIPQNNQSGSNNTCASSPCKFQFKVKQAKDLQGGQPAKIKLTSQYGKEAYQQANLAAMAAQPSTSKPILGQTFHVTVTNRGNKALSGIKVTSDKTHLNIKNYCSGGLNSGKQSTCHIDITGDSQDLVGQSKTIQIGSDQTKSVSTSVQFQKQQGVSAQFDSNGPFKPGQTVTVTATPEGSSKIKLPDVTATSQNGQLKPASTSSQTCSNSSPCQFKFTVKSASKLNGGQSAKVKVSSSYAAKSASPSADIKAMTISASQDQAYLGNALPVTVTNKGSVKLSEIGLTSSQDHLSIDNGCQDGLAPGSNSSCTINITGQSKDLVGKQQTIKIGSDQTASLSTTVAFKQPSLSASIVENGPFKPGQPLEVKVTPKQSGQLKLHGVTAKPQNGQLTSADHVSTGKTCSHDSPCHFQFNVNAISKLNINKPVKIKVTSDYADSPSQLTANVVGMTLSTQNDNNNQPYLGKPFKVVVTNHGNQKLTNIHIKDSNDLKVANQCSDGLPAGKNSTCDIDITGDSTKLLGQSQTITIESDQTDSHSVKETFQKQQSISASFESDGPFEPGQTVKVKVTPKMSGKAKLADVTAKSVNGQLTSDDNASKTCSNDSPCTFKFSVKSADKLQSKTQAKVKISSSYASSSTSITGSIAAMTINSSTQKPYLGKSFDITVTNNGNQKLTGIGLTSSKNHLKVNAKDCSNGLPAGQNSSCQIQITGQSQSLIGKQQTMSVGSKQGLKQSLTVNFQKKQFSLTNVPKAAKVGETVQIQVKPQDSNEVLQGISPSSLTNLQFLSNSDKTTCNQNSQQGSCQLAFKVLNNSTGNPAKVTVSSDFSSTQSTQINIVAIKPDWPSRPPFVSEAFKVGVTNQGSATLNDLSIAGDGLSQDKSDTTCDSSLAKGKSCHFSVKSSKASTTIKLSAQSKTGNQSLQASHQQSFKRPVLKVSASSSTLKPGETFKVIVKPEAAIQYSKVQASSVYGQLTNVTSDQAATDAQATSSMSACPNNGSIDSKCYYKFQVKQAKNLTGGQQAQVKVQSQQAKPQKTNKLDIVWMSSSINQQKLGTGQTFQLTINNKGTHQLTGLSANPSSGLQVVDKQSNCGSSVPAGKSCHFTLTTNDPSSTKQSVQPSSQATGKGQKHTLTIVRPQLQVSHTLVTQPSSKADNYIILKNSSSKQNGVIPYLKMAAIKTTQQQKGGGVSLKEQLATSSESFDSSIPKSCYQLGDLTSDDAPEFTLKPGQTCSVPIKVSDSAWGSTSLSLEGNFVGSPQNSSINIAPSNIEIGGSFAYRTSVSKGAPFITTPTSPYKGYQQPPSSSLSLTNKGPFALKMGQYSNGDLDNITNECNTQVINVGDSCDITLKTKDIVSGLLGLRYHKGQKGFVTVLPYRSIKNKHEFGRYFFPTGLTFMPMRKSPNYNNQQPTYFVQSDSFGSNHLMQAQFVMGMTAYRKGWWAVNPKLNADDSGASKNITSYRVNLNKCPKQEKGGQLFWLNKLFKGYGQFCVMSLDNIKVKPQLDIGENRAQTLIGQKANTSETTLNLYAHRSLVVAGDFAQVSGVDNTTAIARYGPILGLDNNNRWVSLGALSDGDSVNTLLMHRDLYAGGQFKQINRTKVNNIARWTGAQWKALGKGVTNQKDTASVNALASTGDGKGNPQLIFVGGDFTKAGSNQAHNLAAWNVSKQQWQKEPAKTVDHGQVNALMIGREFNLWVGGDFTTAGGKQNVTGIASYDYQSNHWNNNYATDLKGIGDSKPVVYSFVYLPKNDDRDAMIVAGGRFKVCQNGSSGTCGYGLAAYDLTGNEQWQPFAANASQKLKIKDTVGVKTLKLKGKQLLVGGTYLLGGQKHHLASFNVNKGSWKILDDDTMKGSVNAQVLTQNKYYIGGDFSSLDPRDPSKLAKTKLSRMQTFWQSLTNSQYNEVEGSHNIIHGGSIKAMTMMTNILSSPT